MAMWRVSTLLCTSGMATTGSVKVFISQKSKGISGALPGQLHHVATDRPFAPTGFDGRHNAGRIQPQRAQDGSLIAVIDEAVGQTELQHGHQHPVCIQAFLYCATCPADRKSVV